MNDKEAGVSHRLGKFDRIVSYFIVLVVATSMMSNVSRLRVHSSGNNGTVPLLSSEVPDESIQEAKNSVTVPLVAVNFDEFPDDLSEIIEFEKLYNPIIMKASYKYRVDPYLIKAMIVAESGGDPKAVSPSGAKGLMQIMPDTARRLGIKNIFNPEHNILGGVRYFKGLVVRFNGNIKLALAAYNAGIKNVIDYKGIPPFSETSFFVERVLRLHKDFKKRELISMQSDNLPHA